MTARLRRILANICIAAALCGIVYAVYSAGLVWCLIVFLVFMNSVLWREHLELKQKVDNLLRDLFY